MHTQEETTDCVDVVKKLQKLLPETVKEIYGIPFVASFTASFQN